jgi:Transcription factor WhiB
MTSGDRGWMRHGSCVASPGLPWTRGTAEVPSVLVEEMTATCDSCPVRLACVAYVYSARITGGFWAGADRAPALPSDELHFVDGLGVA